MTHETATDSADLPSTRTPLSSLSFAKYMQQCVPAAFLIEGAVHLLHDVVVALPRDLLEGYKDTFSTFNQAHTTSVTTTEALEPLKAYLLCAQLSVALTGSQMVQPTDRHTHSSGTSAPSRCLKRGHEQAVSELLRQLRDSCMYAHALTHGSGSSSDVEATVDASSLMQIGWALGVQSKSDGIRLRVQSVGE